MCHIVCSIRISVSVIQNKIIFLPFGHQLLSKNLSYVFPINMGAMNVMSIPCKLITFNFVGGQNKEEDFSMQKVTSVFITSTF
jgi:hypothetical protein